MEASAILRTTVNLTGKLKRPWIPLKDLVGALIKSPYRTLRLSLIWPYHVQIFTVAHMTILNVGHTENKSATEAGSWTAPKGLQSARAQNQGP